MTGYDAIIKELSRMKDAAYIDEHFMSACAYKDAIRVVKKYRMIVERKRNEKKKEETENGTSEMGKHNAKAAKQD